METSNYAVDLTSIKNTQRYCDLTGAKCINGINEENLWNRNARRRRRSFELDQNELELDLSKLSQTIAFKSLLDTPVRSNGPIVEVS